MKLRSVLPVLAFVATAIGYAAGPEVKFADTTYDFGAFEENDGTVKCVFTYVNTGDEPLSIIASRATCGCTSSSYTKEAVAPGDSGYVEVSYNPTGRPGRFSKKVYVDFNTERPRQTLLIKGVVIGASNTLRGRYPVDAGMLKLRSDKVLLGEVSNGKSKTSFFEVYNATADSLTPRWVSIPRGVKIDTPTPTVGPGEQLSYTIFFVPEKDMYGIYTDTLRLEPAMGETPVEVEMIAIVDEDFSKLTPGQMRDAPAVEVESNTLDFGTIDRNGGPVTRSFIFKNTGKGTMHVRRVYTTDPGITVTTTTDKLKHGKEALVNVTVDPMSIPSEILNGRISVIVNDPRNPTSVVRAVGQLR
ncbi:MAG: DUF1573 domain-containing protein [Clostridiales bacterium]|nr:DUF1573 domain-containing protein [Clostridiales bacterium]